LSEGRPKFRADVQALVLSRELVVLDTWSGVELLEGRLSSALVHGLKGEIADPQMIAQVEESLDAAYELEELRRRGLLQAGEPPADGRESAGEELSIVLAMDYLDPQLEHVNREALAAGRPWMLARPRGTIVWIGPVFVPGRGPCWACLAARLRAVRTAWGLPERREDPAMTQAPVTQIGLDLASLEAGRWKRQPDSRARLLTFDTQSLAQQEHRIARRRDCAACGDPSALRGFSPLLLQNRNKAFTLDGGHRTATPEETFARYVHLVSPLTGIVHDVQRAPGDSGALNTFAARHNYRIGSRNPPDRSFGKGMTAAQARTGALCEALERYSGLFRGDEPLMRATFCDLGDEAVHPNACLGISERQYDAREEWNRHAQTMLRIPEPFDENAETDWVPAWSLTHARKRYVTAAYCYYTYPRGANAFANADSNGNAAGTCLEDAVLQGLLELIERDAAGIWWYGRHRRPAVAMETPYGKAMVHEYAARGRQLQLLDLTTDLGIPVCAAVSFGEEAESFRFGLGAHLDPAIAVSRAITEANQLLAINKRKRRLYRGELADRTYLEPHGSREMTTAAPPSDDLCTDVLACVALLGRLGLEVIVLDQTREDVGLPVVKVIVPGLRHFRPRFAPGRLYDVPQRLGWVENPLREEDLNPAHLLS
jgi:ribosomal protein S12 methylthiotransferase accessory factor